MNFIEDCLLILGLSAGMILAGYWLAAWLTSASPGERLAVAALGGVAAMLWNVSVVNFFQPLSGGLAWACLWPVALTMVSRRTRVCLAQDFGSAFLNRRGAMVAGLGVVFLLALLWPVLTRSFLVFYDGTSNHDSFFWISAAEFLKRHSYMEAPLLSATHPLMDSVAAIIGWKPTWGRMGSEGVLALVSTLAGVSAIKIYLCATAALFIPWIAGVFLVVRTFLVDRLSTFALAALVLLQPVFVFFHGNTNLPNLIGILMGSAVVVATARALQPGPGRIAWLALLAFSFHGLLCAYPEMLPFIAFPGALLWARAWLTGGARATWRPALLVAAAYLAGLVLNPVSSVRAWHGFMISFGTARANHGWANIFEPLSAGQYVPALATLAVQACKDLLPGFGAILSLGLLGAAGLAIKRARDPFGAVAILAGTLALIAYTLATDFVYGWQKSVQFGAIFCAALLPVASIDLLCRAKCERYRRYLVRCAGGIIVVFFTYALVVNGLIGYKWAGRKMITQDWFALRGYARKELRHAPVLIEGASFSMAFFHSMWAVYFLPDNPVYFSARGRQDGGYLRDHVITEASGHVPPTPSPVFLVSRDWAESVDANSPRLFLGDTVALLRRANRVTGWKGFYPENGVPESATTNIVLNLRPYTHSQLRLVLAPRSAKDRALRHWTVTGRVNSRQTFFTNLSGPPPWHFVVPLTAGASNRLEFTASPAATKGNEWPFAVHELRIETLP
jgi:hypothetical protein